MQPRSLKYIAEACGGELLQGALGATARGFSTDSRSVQPGELFLALAGEKFDAHQFLGQVADRGAAAVIAQRDRLVEKPKCPVIIVPDTKRALGQIASAYRADFEIPFIAVGGSNGKTSTKELIAAVLRQKFPALASEASFNNDVGVPLTLLKLDPAHRAAVLEVGTNHPGELAPLLRIIRPRMGVITSIGREHLEFFGDIGGVVKEEGTVAEFLPVNGTLFVGVDSEWSKLILKRTRAKVVRVGWNEKCDFRARHFRMDEQGSYFQVDAAQKDFSGDYNIRLFGKHQVLNALFAVAIGAELGLSRAEIQRGLSETAPAKWRMEYWTVGGVGVLDDCYNANADSMLAGLETLRAFPCSGKRIAVLGDMAELGVHSAEAHRETGTCAGKLGIDRLLAVGNFAKETSEAARKAGIQLVDEVHDVSAVGPTLKKMAKRGDVIFLKASRAMRLEQVSEYLRKNYEELCSA